MVREPVFVCFLPMPYTNTPTVTTGTTVTMGISLGMSLWMTLPTLFISLVVGLLEERSGLHMTPRPAMVVNVSATNWAIFPMDVSISTTFTPLEGSAVSGACMCNLNSPGSFGVHNPAVQIWGLDNEVWYYRLLAPLNHLLKGRIEYQA